MHLKFYFRIIFILMLQIVIMSAGLIFDGNNSVFNLKNIESIELAGIIIKIIAVMLIYFIMGVVCCKLSVNEILITLVSMQIIKILYAGVWKLSMFGDIDAIINSTDRLNGIFQLMLFFISEICLLIGVFITKYIFLKNSDSAIYVFIKNIILICLCTAVISIFSCLCFGVLNFFNYNKLMCGGVAGIYSVSLISGFFYTGKKIRSEYSILIMAEVIVTVLIVNYIQLLIPINLYYFIKLIFEDTNNIMFYYIMSLIPGVAMILGYTLS